MADTTTAPSPNLRLDSLTRTITGNCDTRAESLRLAIRTIRELTGYQGGIYSAPQRNEFFRCWEVVDNSRTGQGVSITYGIRPEHQVPPGTSCDQPGTRYSL